METVNIFADDRNVVDLRVAKFIVQWLKVQTPKSQSTIPPLKPELKILNP